MTYHFYLSRMDYYCKEIPKFRLCADALTQAFGLDGCPRELDLIVCTVGPGIKIEFGTEHIFVDGIIRAFYLDSRSVVREIMEQMNSEILWVQI